MPAEEFVRRLNLSAGQYDTHYAFWIGAGCSISSGIPGAASLVSDRWLPQLQQVRGASELNAAQWAREAIPGHDPDDPGASYGTVMEELFIQPEARQREVEALCDGRFPGFGYAVLAALLARSDGLFNVALTTNFDDLIADAMYVFTEARPLVIPDEALAGFIRPTRMRPLVVKVHGDHRLSPRNTQTETATLKRGISEGIGDLLHDRGVIFVGYGGNDRGISELLHSLPAQALPLGVWWVSRTEPTGVLRDWLEARDAIWVVAPGFDELMLLFQSEFDIPHPKPTKFERLFESYLATFRDLEKRVGRIPDSDPQASSLKGATARAEAVATDWSAVLLQANRIEEEDPDQAEQIYLQGIEEFPRVVFLSQAFAQFLLERGDFTQAITVSENALEQDPENSSLLRIYGHAVAEAGDIDLALETFARRVELAPENLAARADYGIWLVLCGNTADAQKQLDLILEYQPSTSPEFALVAVLLDELEEHEEAAIFHRRAIDLIPENANAHANYARCLIALKRLSEAEQEVDLTLALISPIAVSTLLEALFYKFVMSLFKGEEDEANEILAQMRHHLEGGDRCPIWNFKPVIDFALDVHIPDADWIGPLAEVAGGTSELNTLRTWGRWQASSES